MVSQQTTVTAYWVYRQYDDVAFAIVSSKQEASELKTQYETDFGEPFRMAPEYRTEIPVTELPETWLPDWEDRVPEEIIVTGTFF